jgi:hypothetical protein
VPAEMTYDWPPTGETACLAGHVGPEAHIGIGAIPRLPGLLLKPEPDRIFDTSQGPSKIIAVLSSMKSFTMLLRPLLKSTVRGPT